MTGDELKAAREAAGMTRTELAAAIGVAERSIWRYEGGERKIPGPTSIAIETILGPVKSGTLKTQLVARRSVKHTR